MKKIILFITLIIGSLSAVQAQEASLKSDKVTIEDYEKYIDAKLNIKFREAVIQSLELSEKEIIAFDPLFRAYNREKTALVDRKYRMIDDYTKEMREDDSMKDERDETGDFFEDYWEIEIDEMQLKKKYYDRMDEVMLPRKAMNFFLLEESIQNRIEQNYFSIPLPIIMEIERPFFMLKKESQKDLGEATMKSPAIPAEEFTSKGIDKSMYRKDIDAFTNWAVSNKDDVSLDHNYTHDGLYKLVAAIDGVAMANDIDMSAYKDQMMKVKKLADGLKVDKYSNVHADKASQAFGIVADLMLAMDAKNQFDKVTINEVRMAAKKINPNVLMTKQAPHVRNFFDAALKAINKMSEQTMWAVK